MEDLKDTIKEIKTYEKELGLKSLTDDMILDCSTRIFISNNINSEKSKQHALKKDKTEMVSDRQLWKLNQLGYDGDTSNLTKREAITLIKELNEREQNDY